MSHRAKGRENPRIIPKRRSPALQRQSFPPSPAPDPKPAIAIGESAPGSRPLLWAGLWRYSASSGNGDSPGFRRRRGCNT